MGILITVVGNAKPGQAKSLLSVITAIESGTYQDKALTQSDHRIKNTQRQDAIDCKLRRMVVVLDEELLLLYWLRGQDNTFGDDVDEAPRHLTLEQIFWSSDISIPKPISEMTVYLPNTPAKLVPRVLPTKSQVKINIYTLTQLFTEFDKTCKKIITPCGLTEGEKGFEQTKECYLTEIMCAKTIEKTTSLLTKNEKLKAQLKGKMQYVTTDTVKPKVLTPSMYAIDVEPIPPHNRNNREVHLEYLKHLKESVETLREIELLEYVIGTCPKELSKREKKVATTHLNRKKQVTFKEPCKTSNNNTQTHVEQQKVQKTNVPMIPSTGVNSSTKASGSKPRSNTKNNKILPAKSDNKKIVEAYPKNNKSNLKQKNRVDSRISSKRTIINSNSNSVCKTCNKCLIYANHDKCVVKYLKYVRAPPVKNVLSKVKQVWKATGKLFASQPEHISTSEIVITERFSNTSQKPLTRYKRRNKKEKEFYTDIPTTTEKQTIDAFVKYATVIQIIIWYLDSGCSKHMTGNRSWLKNFIKKFIGTIRFGNDHFGTSMGYRDYVIDLEVAYRKHSGYVRDVDGVELLKGCRGSHLYTISVEDMMKSSPIYLLSKASKNKSELWHHQLNHLNFDTIHDLARKDMVRRLPRLKYEKDHLCSACHLGKSKKYSHKPKSENTITEVLHTLYMDLCGPMRV
ncbi:retrovirus-related pol polyprotein from transposon TNT 1-94 [Tanacetum coccineum]|uniref:Retrovirus-related pol polyprotein from transposon TNT 1-94 n=1 Tax=Tanacetum coccineum TaxID=301880 RepID=A0ABQ4Z141_9ASTR